MDRTHPQSYLDCNKNASRRKPEGKHQIYQVKTFCVS